MPEVLLACQLGALRARPHESAICPRCDGHGMTGYAGDFCKSRKGEQVVCSKVSRRYESKYGSREYSVQRNLTAASAACHKRTAKRGRKGICQTARLGRMH